MNGDGKALSYVSKLHGTHASSEFWVIYIDLILVTIETQSRRSPPSEEDNKTVEFEA